MTQIFMSLFPTETILTNINTIILDSEFYGNQFIYRIDSHKNKTFIIFL